MPCDPKPAGPRLGPDGDNGYVWVVFVHCEQRQHGVGQPRADQALDGRVVIGTEDGLPLSVRGGGHSVAGNAVRDGAVMLGLSGMKALRVDPETRTVLAEPGLTLGEFDRGTQTFGLATTLGVMSMTGIAGLTLGGGLGWLNGRYGLACDNLISADVATADGQLHRASTQENQDLFWSIRGGGGNFGVVTSFEYQLHLVDLVLAGGLSYPLDMAPRVLRYYDDFVKAAPGRAVHGRVARADPGRGAHFATAAPQLELGVGVLPLDRHQPVRIAAEISRLALDPAKLWIGIGSGQLSRPIHLMQRAVAELREFLPEGTRIVVAAMRPRMCHLGGAIADGILLNWMLPAQATEARRWVQEGADQAGRAAPIVASYVRVAVGPGSRRRLRDEESRYRNINDAHRQHFQAMDVPLGSVGVAASARPEVLDGLAPYHSALDLPVARLLTDQDATSLPAAAIAAAP
jgi:FAD binding domain